MSLDSREKKERKKSFLSIRKRQKSCSIKKCGRAPDAPCLIELQGLQRTHSLCVCTVVHTIVRYMCTALTFREGESPKFEGKADLLYKIIGFGGLGLNVLL